MVIDEDWYCPKACNGAYKRHVGCFEDLMIELPILVGYSEKYNGDVEYLDKFRPKGGRL